MRFAHILHELYEEPWLITASFHEQLCAIVQSHMTGDAHAEGGRAELFEDVEEADDVMQIVGGVAMINVAGVIARRVGMIEKSSGVSDIMDISEAIEEAVANDEVKGIFLDVDSPGGGVTGVPEFGRMLADIDKPVLAYTEGLMASAGYWMAVGADLIFASQSAVVGSIGVYMSILDQSRAYENAGLRQHLIATGKFKGAGTPGVPVTEAQLANFQEGVDEVFDWFKAAVTMNRNVTEDSMQGQTFHAKEAQARGLIDGIMSKPEAMMELLALIELG